MSKRYKLTVKEFRKLSENGRFWTYFFYGQSCVNCDYMKNGICTNQHHLDIWTMKQGYDIKISMSYYENKEDIFDAGSKCEDWRLIKPCKEK